MSGVGERVAELAARRVPFVLARVVLAEKPTSARPGDEALVLADGTMEGFVGGDCAEATVRAQALAVLDSGEPVVLRISATDEPPQGGKVMAHNPCLSGGTLEIYLEPRHPPPRMAVVGDGPIARALRTIGDVVGFEVVDPGATDLAALVVASHGRDETAPLSAALNSGVDYVGLVASPKRGAAVAAALDVTGAERIVTPAGLDIGARTPEEVALSIFADVDRQATSTLGPAGSRCEHAAERRGRDRPGVRDDRRCRRVLTAPRPRGPAVLVLRDGLPAGVRRRAGSVLGHVTEDHLVDSVDELRAALDGVDYLANLGLATALFCAVRLRQPVLLEGEAGVGKTESAKALAEAIDTAARAPAVLRGHHLRRGALRVELSPPAARHPHGRVREAPTFGRTISSRRSSSSIARCCGPSATRVHVRRCC